MTQQSLGSGLILAPHALHSQKNTQASDGLRSEELRPQCGQITPDIPTAALMVSILFLATGVSYASLSGTASMIFTTSR